MGELLGYSRISTIEQNTRLQTDALGDPALAATGAEPIQPRPGVG